MNDTKHTPGPWETDLMADREGDWYEVVGPMAGRSGTVADTLNRDSVIGPDEDWANAKLIAASPDLLGACRAALDFLDQPVREEDVTMTLAERLGLIGGYSVSKQLFDALLKATGGRP